MAKPKPFKNTNYTIFATRTREFTPGLTYSLKKLLTQYCKEKFISRRVVERFAINKWINVSKVRGRIYVEEVCSEKIEEYLKAFKD